MGLGLQLHNGLRLGRFAHEDWKLAASRRHAEALSEVTGRYDK